MSATKPSLLYLDDEEINLLLFKEMFKRDFEVFTTSSPHDAIDHVSSNPVDYILTDQLMPIMTGVQFLEKLTEIELPSDPMKIIISGFTQEGDVDRALKTNLIHHFVSKPWSYQNLKELLLSKST